MQIFRCSAQHFDRVDVVDDWRQQKCQDQKKMANNQQWRSKMHVGNIAQPVAGISPESPRMAVRRDFGTQV